MILTLSWLKRVFIGKSRELSDSKLFHSVSLVALFAWVGLGADGLSSSCYGPEETFRALGAYPLLSVFVALAGVATIFAICASYSQIISSPPPVVAVISSQASCFHRPPALSPAARCWSIMS